MSDFKIANATQAYQNAAKIGGNTFSVATPTLPEQKIGPDFGEMVNQAIGNSIDTQKAAEIAAAGNLVNKTSVDDLAIAITNADLTLRTVIAVRDKVIAAYQDIIKMPI